MENYYYEEEYVENRRYRRKHFYNAIREQIEFYLGDINLSKDRFFSNLIQQDGYVEVSVILKCNKLKRLTESAAEVTKALKKSTMLTVSEDDTKIYRVTPVGTVENTDETTIYVENVPPYAEHDWMKSVFSCFGKVEYISIPQFKEEGYNKGYAFVQFDSEKCVDKAIKAFQRVNSCLPHDMDPEELLSIKTFKEQESILDRHLNKQDVANNEQYTSYYNDWPPSKRMKTWEEEFNSSYGGPSVININCEKKVKQNVKENVIQNMEEEMDGHVDEDNSVKTKKNSKKRKERKKPVITHGMLILTKKQWKKLRNKYLDTQRKKVKKVKSQVQNVKTVIKRSNTNIVNDNCNNLGKGSNNIRVKYQPGVIIKLTFKHPITDLKSFKAEARRYTEVQYVDAEENSAFGYLRCTSAEAAKQLVSLNHEKWTMEILRGFEERKYWGKIFEDRKEKLTHKIRNKSRGKDKLTKEVTNAINTHIMFED